MYFLPLFILVLVKKAITQAPSPWNDKRWPKDEKFEGPGRFTREDEVNRFQHRHLVNMTENICKDAMYKVRQADLVQTAYMHTIGYELGMLTCGIMEKFKHMLRIYRYYSNPVMFKDNKHTITQIMNAYSIMQSDYSELIAEIVLYYEVLEEHRKKETAKLMRARVYAKKHKMAVQAVLDLMNKGIDLENLDNTKVRRSMQTVPPKDDEDLEIKELIEEIKTTANDDLALSKLKADLKIPELTEHDLKLNQEEPNKKYGKNLFTKKNSTEEAEYKKKLRYIMWAEKWNGYNPAAEGVHIDDTIARLGFNESDFLLNELRGDV